MAVDAVPLVFLLAFDWRGGVLNAGALVGLIFVGRGRGRDCWMRSLAVKLVSGFSSLTGHEPVTRASSQQPAPLFAESPRASTLLDNYMRTCMKVPQRLACPAAWYAYGAALLTS